VVLEQFRPTPPTTPTTSCRPPRSWNTGTSTALRPHRRAAEPPGHRAHGPGRPTPRSSAGWPRAWDSPSPAFSDSDESLCRVAFGDRVDFDELLEQGFCHAGSRCALCRGRLPHGLGPLRVLQRAAGAARPGRPARPRAQLRSRRQLATSYPLAMISPPARNFLNSSFVNVQEPARHRRRAAAGNACRDAAARGISTARWCGSSTTAANTGSRRSVSARARPGVVNGLGIWWRKLGLDGTNVNQLTSQKLTDLGGPGVLRLPGRSPARVRKKALYMTLAAVAGLAVAATVCLSGCSNLGYYWQSASGHMKIMATRRGR
jgi:hypothetical protein